MKYREITSPTNWQLVEKEATECCEISSHILTQSLAHSLDCLLSQYSFRLGEISINCKWRGNLRFLHTLRRHSDTCLQGMKNNYENFHLLYSSGEPMVFRIRVPNVSSSASPPCFSAHRACNRLQSRPLFTLQFNERLPSRGLPGPSHFWEPGVSCARYEAPIRVAPSGRNKN
jgi:hypothetical protein